MSKTLNILGLSGSLRGDSYNSAALRVAQAEVPEGVTLTIADWSGIPVYDQDLNDPAAAARVTALAKQVREAGALLFATPEYNYSIPGGLKNLIDWLSREDPQPFAGKPAAIMSASMGVLGGVRAQYDLRRVGVYLDLRFVNKPEVMIGQAHTRFDNGELTDQDTRAIIAKLVASLARMGRQNSSD